MPDKPPEAMGRQELEAAVRASRAVPVHNADIFQPPQHAAVAVPAVQEATVVMPTTTESKAAEESIKSSWWRVEAWLIVSYQIFATWAGYKTTLAVLDMFRFSDDTESSLALIAAIGGIGAFVGTVPFLYLKARVGERKEAVTEVAPTIVMNRRQPPSPPGTRNGGILNG